jgi:hypothetical protein
MWHYLVIGTEQTSEQAMRYVYAEGLVDGITNCVEIWINASVAQAERGGFLEFMEVFGTGASFVQVLNATSFEELN